MRVERIGEKFPVDVKSFIYGNGCVAADSNRCQKCLQENYVFSAVDGERFKKEKNAPQESGKVGNDSVSRTPRGGKIKWPL
jgi:hypothetical protein